MIRSVLPLQAAAGRGTELEEFYAGRGVLERARTFPGCRDAVLLRVWPDGPSRPATTATHLVIADWDSAEDYRRWVGDPWRAALAEELTRLLDDDEPVVGRLWEAV